MIYLDHSIYLDHNATTPLAAEVAAAMAPWQTGRFGNPSSQHRLGRQARQTIDDAREAIGRMLGADLNARTADRVIFTSGGTEANHLAIMGLAGSHTPGEMIVSAIEHPSVLGPAELLQRRGWTVHRLRVTSDGVIDLSSLDEVLSQRTRLVSVMLANHETGVIQPIAEIARRCAALGVPLHTDAAQAVGKVPVDFRALGASLMTVAPHKFHGPLGIGALVVRAGVTLEPVMTGGFQQEGLRPGTEPVPLIVGMQAALEACQREGAPRIDRMRRLRDRFEAGLLGGYPGELVVNGAGAERLPHTSNLAFVAIDRQALLMALDLAGVACSTGSACASGSSEPSPVLMAMGLPKRVLDSSLRFSLGATTSEAEIDEAVRRIVETTRRMTQAAPNAGRPVRTNR